MKLNCLIATSFIGVDEQLATLQEEFNCVYKPDAMLPNDSFKDIHILVVNPNNLNWRLESTTLDSLTNLKFILTISTGVAHIDLTYIAERGIELISLKDSTHQMNDITATAELAFLFFLAKSRNFKYSSSLKSVQKWDWRECLGQQLREQAVGIIGMGRLGKLFQSYCRAFGCSTVWFDPNIAGGVSDIEEIFKHCDVISIHANYIPGEKFLIDSNLLLLAKPDVHIINTARGELIDEEALVNFLKRNSNAHYSADVLSDEQNRNQNILYNYFNKSSNVTLTPHIGGMTSGSRKLAYSLGINKFLTRVSGKNV